MGIPARSLAVVWVALLMGCGGASRPGATAAADPEPTSPTDIEAIYEARTDSARMRFSDADVRFVTDMIAHHAQALEMASLAPGHGASPSVRTLAARITTSQEDEIALMRQWLEDRRQPIPEIMPTSPSAVANADHASHVHANMPGMLTPEQMGELERARGAEFDRLFLTYMIQHHQGAVTMVYQLVRTDGAAQEASVFKLASDIQADQLAEITRMERMLEAMEGVGGGAGR
jgi:uncharacterized protein (DUF305 family)